MTLRQHPNVSTRDIEVRPGKQNKIFCLGNLSLLNQKGVGFCGSRKVSESGKLVAADCASQLANLGYSVVSGYAAGVDIIAHKTALLKGGSTIIVLPEGIDHFRIRKEIAEVWDWSRVLVVSQFMPSDGWTMFRAMARNELIISLSSAMIVIEAGEKGGTYQAGLSALRVHCPLYVVEYGCNEQAGGNKVLISKGGVPLKKSPMTNSANLIGLLAQIESKKYSEQLPLF